MQLIRFVFRLGNRLSALVSAFLIAIATDRALLVCWPHSRVPKQHPSGEIYTMPPLEHLLKSPAGINWQCPRAWFNPWESSITLNDEDEYFLQSLRYLDLNSVFPFATWNLELTLDTTELLLQVFASLLACLSAVNVAFRIHTSARSF